MGSKLGTLFARAGHEVTFEHFRPPFYCPLKSLQRLYALAFEFDRNKDAYWQPDFCLVEHRHIARDDSRAFEPPDSPKTGRRRQVHLFRQIGKADPAVALKYGQDFSVNYVKP